MIISGLIINSSPGKLNQVQKEITIYDGVEVSSIIDEERILIAVHSSSEEEKYLISKKIENIEGVLGINFVYEYFKNLCHKYWEYPQKIVPTVVISRR
jgi:nitrate reductase NapAB chaperone NapD